VDRSIHCKVTVYFELDQGEQVNLASSFQWFTTRVEKKQ